MGSCSPCISASSPAWLFSLVQTDVENHFLWPPLRRARRPPARLLLWGAAHAARHPQGGRARAWGGFGAKSSHLSDLWAACPNSNSCIHFLTDPEVGKGISAMPRRHSVSLLLLNSNPPLKAAFSLLPRLFLIVLYLMAFINNARVVMRLLKGLGALLGSALLAVIIIT